LDEAIDATQCLIAQARQLNSEVVESRPLDL
jgi:hypothetical protein